MNPRVLLDTHVLIRWMSDAKRLSREQARILAEATRRSEQVAISAMTLLELALLFESKIRPVKFSFDEALRDLETSPFFRILPISIDVAKEFTFLETLRDPGDRVIVATARVHGLRLLTSDQRIIESNFVSTVE